MAEIIVEFSYLAEATQFGDASGTTPFPIGVAKKGKLVLSINSRTSFSAFAYAAPLPTTTKGLLAFDKTETAFSISFGFGNICGGVVGP